METENLQRAQAQQACSIEDVVRFWLGLRRARNDQILWRDEALSATMLLAPDSDNIFRVMTAGALARRWSGLAFGAAFLPLIAQAHRPQMNRRLAECARKRIPSVTRASNRANPDAAFDIVLLPLRSAPQRAGGACELDASVLAGFSPVPAHSFCRPCMEDLILEQSDPLPGFAAPVRQP